MSWNEAVIPAYKPGDIIGFTSEGWTGIVIPLGTMGIPFWSLSHVGIVADSPKGLVLFESTTLNLLPCVLTNRMEPYGAQAHRVEHVLRLYHGKIWHYPLINPLTDAEGKVLSDFLIDKLYLKYNTINAFRSGLPIRLSLVDRLLGLAHINGVFCSELCAASHAKTGRFDTSNPTKWSPRKFVNEFMNERGQLGQPVRCK